MSPFTAKVYILVRCTHAAISQAIDLKTHDSPIADGTKLADAGK